MKKKIVSIMLTAAMTISMLAGCGSTSDNSSESTGGNTEKAADADSSGDEVTLEFLSCKVEDAPKEALDEIISNFEKDNPGVKIEVQSMNSDNLKTTLRSRAASGDMPDIVTWMKKN